MHGDEAHVLSHDHEAHVLQHEHEAQEHQAKPRAARDLERRDLLRPRQRPRADVLGDRDHRPGVHPAPRRRRQPDRVPEDLQARGQAGARRRDREGLRDSQERVRPRDRRRLRRREGRGLSHDRDRGVRRLRGDRPDLLRADVLPRAGRRRRARVRPAAPRDGAVGAGRHRAIRDAQSRASRLPSDPGRRDHAREDVLRGRDPAHRRDRAAERRGRQAGARDGSRPHRPLHVQVEARELHRHLSRAAARGDQGEEEGQGGPPSSRCASPTPRKTSSRRCARASRPRRSRAARRVPHGHAVRPPSARAAASRHVADAGLRHAVVSYACR